MKTEHILFLVLLLLVALMIRNPKRTTAQITNGEQGAIGVGGAVLGGFFGGGQQQGNKRKG